jgi:hypothetical protein
MGQRQEDSVGIRFPDFSKLGLVTASLEIFFRFVEAQKTYL